MLGRPWSAWNGAVNILYPPMQTGFVRSRLFLYEEIKTWGDTLHSRISKSLAWVTNNTNIPRLRRRIRPEGVVQLAKRPTFASSSCEKLLRWTPSNSDKNSIAHMDRCKREMIDRIISASERPIGRRKKTEYRNLYDDTKSELRKKEFEIQSLKDQLAKTGAGRSSSLDVENLISLVLSSAHTTGLS